jgi:hypothetical protein
MPSALTLYTMADESLLEGGWSFVANPLELLAKPLELLAKPVELLSRKRHLKTKDCRWKAASTKKLLKRW